MKQLLGRILALLIVATCARSLALTVFSAQAVIPVQHKNEDVCLIKHEFLSEQQHLFMVCDGHSIGRHETSNELTGAEAASYVVNQLPQFIAQEFAPNRDASDNFLERAIVQTENNMGKFRLAGTTLSLVFVENGMLHIGNIGDSRVVLSINGKASQPIMDHSLDNEKEISRLKETGHFSPIARACLSHDTENQAFDPNWKCEKSDGHCKFLNTLPIEFQYMESSAIARIRYTRSLGDKYLKLNNKRLLISNAEIVQMPITNSMSFAIIASDGVFETEIDDPISNQEAVDIVASTLALNDSIEIAVQQAANELAQLAEERVGFDDIGIVVVVFKHAEF